MRSKFYNSGQLQVVFPFLENIIPKWLIIGGPADGDEARTAINHWPDIRVIGIEPNPEAWKWQLANGWPRGHRLITNALSDRSGLIEMVREPDRIRNASADPASVEGNRDNPDCVFFKVWATTLDLLHYRHGLVDSIVWLDIEGSELKALQGATRLIQSKHVLAWNLEMMDRVPGLMEEVPKLLKGYRAVKDWDVSEFCRNRIFLRDDIDVQGR